MCGKEYATVECGIRGRLSTSCAGERLAYPRVLQKDAEAYGSESEEDLPPVDVWGWTCVYVGGIANVVL